MLPVVLSLLVVHSVFLIVLLVMIARTPSEHEFEHGRESARRVVAGSRSLL